MVDTHSTLSIPKALVKLRSFILMDDEDAELVRAVLVDLARAAFHRGKLHGKKEETTKTKPDGLSGHPDKTKDHEVEDHV